MSGNINPDRTQFEAFKALPRDQPVNMLNLVRVKDVAVYPDGREVSGREAYSAYGRESAPVLERVGGTILWRGSFETVLIGPSDEHWDFCFIARYPTAGAFLQMVTDGIPESRGPSNCRRAGQPSDPNGRDRRWRRFRGVSRSPVLMVPGCSRNEAVAVFRGFDARFSLGKDKSGGGEQVS